MRTSFLFAALLSTSVAMPAVAADDYVEVAATPVEIGTQWYIRGDIGLTADGERLFETSSDDTDGTLERLTDDTNATFLVGAGVGVRITPSLRGELNFTWDGRNETTNRENVVTDLQNTPCEQTFIEVFDLSGGVSIDPTGRPSNCFREDSAQYDTQTLSADFLYDLPVEGRFRPFVGAGLGLRRVGHFVVEARYMCNPQRLEYCSSVGGTGDDRPEIGENFYSAGVETSGSAYHLVGRLTAGVGFHVSPNTNIDLSYTYSKTQKGALWGGSSAYDSTRFDLDNHQLKLGVRYDLW